jgi:aspartyl aminopeptidase
MTSMIDKLLTFLKSSPSPFHAVDIVLKELNAVGYMRLRENDPRWAIKRGGKYVLTRNGSSLIAFVVGEQFVLLDIFFTPLEP